MSDDPSYYEVLGVPRDATLEQIDLAYRNKAILCHPDKNPQGNPQISNEMMQAVNMAHDILINPTKRAEFDQTLARGGSDKVGHGSGQKAAKNILTLENTVNQLEITVVECPQAISNDPVEESTQVSEDLVLEAIKQRDWATLSDVFSKLVIDYSGEPGDSFLTSLMNNFWRKRSVLHVVVMIGCFPLVKQLLDMLTSDFENIGKEKALEFIRALDPESKLTALQMADEIIGNRSISEYIKFVVRFLESSEKTISDFIGNWNEVLFEAYPHTRWYGRLKKCVERLMRGEDIAWSMPELINGLHENSRLLLETFHGLSALHLAILLNDPEIIRIFRALFDGEEGIVWGDSYYPRDLTWEMMMEAKGHGGIEFKKDIFYKTEFNLLPYYTVSASEIARTIPPGGSEFSKRLFRPLLPPSQGFALVLEQSKTFSEMGDHINEEWNEEWQERFEADVDFNFEVEPRKSLLRVHHACKDPLRFLEFLKSISQHETFNLFSTQMHDAQGRTLHHILLDHHTVDKLPGWAFTEIFSIEVSKFCIEHAQDSKGRTLMDILIGKNHIQLNINLKPYSYFDMKFEQDNAESDGYSRVFGNFYVACALQQTNITSQPTWVEALQAYLSKLDTLKLLPFATATSTNQSMLQALSRMELGVDLMVQDKKKRTLLHYAADPTLFKFETLFDSETQFDVGIEFEHSMIHECFSTVEDYGQFRQKPFSKKDTRVTYNDQNPSIVDEKDEIKQSNARRRALILMLVQRGLDLSQQDIDKKVPNLGPTLDADYQTWWYDMVVKDAIDNKQSFNQAGNALSVVGTLVAATSYIGPLQPPMSYTEGLVRYSEKLVEVFMVTNTLAFFLAMASVMFAVVPSLPMPRESIVSELKRARQMVLVSLCLLLVAIATIIVSFSAASVVVNQYEHSFPRSNILLGPLLVGWCICFIAIASFFLRILRLSFYENSIVQIIYRFSLRKFCTRSLKSYIIILRHHFSDFVEEVFFPMRYFATCSEPDDLTILNVFCIFFYFMIVLVVIVPLFFPIYHVIHIAILDPMEKLNVRFAQFYKHYKRGGTSSR